MFRRDALAGQSFANADEIEQAMQAATTQLNNRASLGSGDGLPRGAATCVASFVIAFEGWSTISQSGNRA
ncbi:hypothetical protein [Ktedonobacter robiniae]|uniref:DhaL domain-containing protein n=1 Tax=Ktedonobacter robiniae TaxID=2778365 RepID=A0ABQ3V683_9CHLR|nr:hypothetical protein [Ktedonobacter robiniae]GHO60741.1 hypothetical protein KSB_92160 [Ktedonobacter robiniae]